MTYKMFVCDLDGTLLNNDHKISKDNIKAIKALEEKGVKFIVATGRTKYMLEDYLETIDYKRPIIWSNGAAISDTRGTILQAKEIAIKDSRKIMELAQQYHMDYVVYTLDGIVGTGRKGRMKRLEDYNETVKKEYRIPLTFDKMLSSNLHKHKVIKFSFSSEDSTALQEFQKAIYLNLNALSSVFSHDTLLDVTRKDATKGEAALYLAKYYDIKPEEIVAIGDQQNDMSMLEVSGLALTLENAVDAVKKIATHVTKDNHSSGVAYAINRYIL